MLTFIIDSCSQMAVKDIHIEAMEAVGIPGLIPCCTQGAVNKAQRSDTVCAIEVKILHDELTCHRPAQHSGIFHIQVIQQFLDILAIAGDGMALEALGGKSLTSGVKADHPVGLSQRFQIVFKESGVAAEAGNQYNGAAFFGAVIFKVKDRIVASTEVVISCSCHMGSSFLISSDSVAV